MQPMQWHLLSNLFALCYIYELEIWKVAIPVSIPVSRSLVPILELIPNISLDDNFLYQLILEPFFRRTLPLVVYTSASWTTQPTKFL